MLSVKQSFQYGNHQNSTTNFMKLNFDLKLVLVVLYKKLLKIQV